MKVAVFGTKSYDKEFFKLEGVNTTHELVFFESRLRVKTAPLARGFDAVCVFVNDVVDTETVKMLGEFGIKVIALRCAGFNNVDLIEAEKQGIEVLRVPAYSPYAVAEHTLALILTLNRKTHKAYNRVREGNFSLDRLTGFDIYGKTVGVIGTGKIGQIFARIMKGMGCKVVGFDLYPNKEFEKEGVLEYVTLNELLENSDIISLHCPLTPQTHHIINDHSIWRMKKGAMLINTSRGRLIDTESAIRALSKGHLGYLGIDVYEQEEKLFFRDLSETLIRDEKMLNLMSFPNVLVTGHQAFFTDTALTQIARVTLGNLTAFEKGEELVNRVGSEAIKG
ncbi:2-hydroxyacid dehydrogenase [Flammeovirga sp. EKP202]|uniref:2-hydroxyacid dehydrogenase n=1 Tax=Flammeovirga sp. EKP202 TaxID=2770592 RepID=UPI00165F0B3E|nr:2-hydroxyacid dehydrogenase [Flammeovirga sp. EKP202]MBD0402083.1 2-hydroxyacid dehydrogenase [Flammeovirga sp. EKP202]